MYSSLEDKLFWEVTVNYVSFHASFANYIMLFITSFYSMHINEVVFCSISNQKQLSEKWQMRLHVNYRLIFTIDSIFYHHVIYLFMSESWECQTAIVVNLKDDRRLPTVHSLVIITPDIWTYVHGLCLVWLWYLTSLSTMFQLYRGGQFYWWRKPQYPEKTTNLS